VTRKLPKPASRSREAKATRRKKSRAGRKESPSFILLLFNYLTAHSGIETKRRLRSEFGRSGVEFQFAQESGKIVHLGNFRAAGFATIEVGVKGA